MFAKPQKKYLAAGLGALAIVAAGAISAFAAHEYRRSGEEGSREWRRGMPEMAAGDVQRAVNATASGADVSFVSSDTGALSRIRAEFLLLKGSPRYQDSAYSFTGTAGTGSFVVSVASSDTDVARLIQTLAADGKSGPFGIGLVAETAGANDVARHASESKEEGHGRTGRERESR